MENCSNFDLYIVFWINKMYTYLQLENHKKKKIFMSSYQQKSLIAKLQNYKIFNIINKKKLLSQVIIK